jgi:glutamate carboxypeptidase
MTNTTTSQKIQTYLESNLAIYLDLLRQMVEINSFTANPDGVNALGELTARIFAKLGFSAETIQSTNPDFGRHLVLTKPGSSERKIGLVSHLDTVFPPDEEIQNNFTWRQEGNRIYGPGTVDIKGGTIVIYMLLAALQKFAPEIFQKTTWVVLLNASEERGGFDFGQLCVERLGQDALAALIFEGGRLVDNRYSIVAARKGIALYGVTVNGKAAHAGNGHSQGTNAIVQIADTIRQTAALTDYERNLTFNVGVVSGGTVSNRIPHYAEASVEMRAFDVDIFEEGIAGILALNGQSSVHSVDGDDPCQVKVELRGRVEPWAPNPATDRLLRIWQETAELLGMVVEREERGGLSDGNFFWQQVPSLDGLGPSGGNAHCSERSEDGRKDQEYIEIPSMVPKALLNAMAILRLVYQVGSLL